MDSKHLHDLQRLIDQSNRTIPAWLEDLLLHGPRFEASPKSGIGPDRILLTQLLATWLRCAGLSQEQCLEWLLGYCCDVLKAYSKSGMSAIRHGTKYSARWAYIMAFPFDFEKLAQELPVGEFEGCPRWIPVFAKWWDQLYEFKDQARKAYVPPVFEPFVPVKKRFAEQFKKAEEYARQKRVEGMTLEAIAASLNEQGFLTRTGRKWTLSLVMRTVIGCKARKEVATDPSADRIADPGQQNPDQQTVAPEEPRCS